MESKLAKKTLELAAKIAAIRPRDLDAYGIPRKYLNLLYHKGMLQKIQFMCVFAWWRNWALVREEWKLTKKDLDDAKARSEEINRRAAEQLLWAIDQGWGDED